MAVTAFAAVRKFLDSGLKLSREVFRRRDVAATIAVGAAFVAGWATFAVYGAFISLQDFVRDHIGRHILGRLRLSNVNLADVEQGDFVYPSIVGLWREFFDHLSWFYAALMVAAVVRAARRPREAEGLLLWWVLIGALGFSLVDWRQTKHLAHILPPLVVLLAVFWSSLESRVRHVATAILAAGFVWNVWRIVQTMRDFDYLTVQPIW
jgi:hypothetical protein